MAKKDNRLTADLIEEQPKKKRGLFKVFYLDCTANYVCSSSFTCCGNVNEYECI